MKKIFRKKHNCLRYQSKPFKKVKGKLINLNQKAGKKIKESRVMLLPSENSKIGYTLFVRGHNLPIADHVVQLAIYSYQNILVFIIGHKEEDELKDKISLIVVGKYIRTLIIDHENQSNFIAKANDRCFLLEKNRSECYVLDDGVIIPVEKNHLQDLSHFCQCNQSLFVIIDKDQYFRIYDRITGNELVSDLFEDSKFIGCKQQDFHTIISFISSEPNKSGELWFNSRSPSGVVYEFKPIVETTCT